MATAKVTGPKLGCSHEAEPHIIIMQSQQFPNVWTSWRCGWLKGTNVIGVYRVISIDIYIYIILYNYVYIYIYMCVCVIYIYMYIYMVYCKRNSGHHGNIIHRLCFTYYVFLPHYTLLWFAVSICISTLKFVRLEILPVDRWELFLSPQVCCVLLCWIPNFFGPTYKRHSTPATGTWCLRAKLPYFSSPAKSAQCMWLLNCWSSLMPAQRWQCETCETSWNQFRHTGAIWCSMVQLFVLLCRPLPGLADGRHSLSISFDKVGFKVQRSTQNGCFSSN